MKIISHRGNLEGRKKDLENNPIQIKKTLSIGFEVEIDVWFYDNTFYLGHDEPKYKIFKKFLFDSRLWCHAKNKEAFDKMLELKIHCFWHKKDEYTLTSKGIPWCFPSNYLSKGITVIFDKKTIPPKNIGGICTDYPVYYSSLLKALI